MLHSPFMRKTSRAWRRCWSERDKVDRTFRGSRLYISLRSVNCPVDVTHLGLRTDSTTRTLKVAEEMSTRVMGRRSRPASSLWDTRMKSEKRQQVRSLRYCGATAHFSHFANSTCTLPHLESSCGSRLRRPMKKNCWRRRWSVDGAAVRPCCWLPTGMMHT